MATESSPLLGHAPRPNSSSPAPSKAPSADTDGSRKSATTSLTGAALARANNRFVLWCTIAVVSLVTAALAVAAVLSRSLALTADVVQNAVDLSTYVVNLYAEYETERMAAAGKSHVRGKRLELFAACFSVAGLIGVGAYVLWAAIGRFHEHVMPHAGPGIDAHLLLAFTVLGCVADIFTLGLFMRYAAPERKQVGGESEKNVNMVSATAHVVTDAIRSFTLLTGAFLIYLQHHNVIHLPVSEDVMDGYLSCFVVGCMGVAALFVLKEIAGLLLATSEEAGGVGFLCKPGSALEDELNKNRYSRDDALVDAQEKQMFVDSARKHIDDRLSVPTLSEGDSI